MFYKLSFILLILSISINSCKNFEEISSETNLSKIDRGIEYRTLGNTIIRKGKIIVLNTTTGDIILKTKYREKIRCSEVVYRKHKTWKYDNGKRNKKSQGTKKSKVQWPECDE